MRLETKALIEYSLHLLFRSILSVIHFDKNRSQTESTQNVEDMDRHSSGSSTSIQGKSINRLN